MLCFVKDLSVRYKTQRGQKTAVDRVSFSIQEGEILSLVGGSGSGKSSVALALGRLTDFVPCEVDGEVVFGGKNVFDLDRNAIQHFRRHEIAYVFQEPASSLNPVMRVGEQVAEALSTPGVESRVSGLLREVALLDTERIMRAYPHELSGGMKQRVMIAMALAKNPKLIVADEPTTALDVVTERGILNLFVALREKKISVLFITHALTVASAISDRILVMQNGRIVEEITSPKSFEPAHPYTAKLWSAAMAGKKPKSYFEV